MDVARPRRLRVQPAAVAAIFVVVGRRGKGAPTSPSPSPSPCGRTVCQCAWRTVVRAAPDVVVVGYPVDHDGGPEDYVRGEQGCQYFFFYIISNRRGIEKRRQKKKNLGRGERVKTTTKTPDLPSVLQHRRHTQPGSPLRAVNTDKFLVRPRKKKRTLCELRILSS